MTVPIIQEQQQQVVSRTHELIHDAAIILETRFATPGILFSLTGQRAGLYAWRGKHDCHINYNPYVFAVDFEHHLKDTVAHEVAHHIAHQLHGHKIKPHGKEWKLIAKLLDATPSAHGHYSLEGIKVRRQRRFEYHCQCQAWSLSTTRHNRIQAGACYRCKTCGTALSLDMNQTRCTP